MKVGIVSIYDNENMGNRLQNYALQQVLSDYTDTVLTIRNKPKGKTLRENLIKVSPLSESVLLNRLLGKRRKARLLQFNRDYISVSRTCYWSNGSAVSLKRRDRCDLYCAGSDQVWNPKAGRTGLFNYLHFADKTATFSYAASFGLDAIPEENREMVRRGLSNIRYLSLREEAGKRIAEDLTGRTDAVVLVDPTLLLTREKWDKISSKPKEKLPGKYILSYFLGEISQKRRNAICQKAEELGCEIIELMNPASPFYAISPGEFLYIIQHADHVCTDSFHGSIFSFLYQRPLAIFGREGALSGMGSRLNTLAETFRLESCLAKENRFPKETVDYAKGYAVLSREREKAREFLDKVFREAERALL